jgi:hypothetical protein
MRRHCGRRRGGSPRQLRKVDARDVTSLWTFVTELDHDSRMAPFAHCVALTVNAVKLPWERRSRTMATADKLAGTDAVQHISGLGQKATSFDQVVGARSVRWRAARSAALLLTQMRPDIATKSGPYRTARPNLTELQLVASLIWRESSLRSNPRTA